MDLIVAFDLFVAQHRNKPCVSDLWQTRSCPESLSAGTVPASWMSPGMREARSTQESQKVGSRACLAPQGTSPQSIQLKASLLQIKCEIVTLTGDRGTFSPTLCLKAQSIKLMLLSRVLGISEAGDATVSPLPPPSNA